MTITEKLSDWYWNLSPGKHRLVKVLIWLAIISVPVYIFLMPLKGVPIKVPIGEATPRAIAASELFWEIFHADDLDRSQEAIDSLTAAYAEIDDPGSELTSLLAGAHLWRFMSRNRLDLTAEQMRPELERTLMYGQRVSVLDSALTKTTAPSVLAMAEWLSFSVDGQTDSLSRVHIDILENAITWPPFAGFMQGYLIAPMFAGDSHYYPEAMVGYRFMLDTCASFKLPKMMHFTKIAHTLYGFKSLFAPVCYNNVVAPHSIEGTLFAIADTYLKGGDMESAELWYNNAKTSPTYATWRYQELLDHRLANLEEMRRKFADDSGKLNVTEPAMVMQSEVACGMCHTN